jgi:hypothetical protein
VELGHKQVFLTVPSFVVGYPTFDRGAAARYMTRQLKLGGFDVRLVSDYDMYVSWIIPKKVKEKVVEPDETEFPDLMNLKKMADKYRRGA